MKEDDVMHHWVVHYLPDNIVLTPYMAVRWDITDKAVPTRIVRTAATLEEVRAKLPGGLHRMMRFPEDPVSLVEVWL